MQASQTKARNCRSTVIGAQLEREILTLCAVGARLEEAVEELTRPVPRLFGRGASSSYRRRAKRAPGTANGVASPVHPAQGLTREEAPSA